MVRLLRFTWQLLTLTSLLAVAGTLSVLYIPLAFPLNSYLITLVAFMVINMISYLIMGAGTGKKGQDGMIILIAGVGVKFLLYLLYILIFWLVTKNLGVAFIVTFFALYLIFTFFLAIHLLKIQNNK